MLAEEYYKLKNKYRNCLFGGFFFLVILSLFFAIGSYMLAMQVKAEYYVETEAIIVDYVIRPTTRSHSDGHSSYDHAYYHVVEYEFDGQTYRGVCDTESSEKNAKTKIGEKMTVYVNPKNPDKVVYRNSTHIILISASYAVSIIGFVVIALVFYKAYEIKNTLKEYD